MNLQDIFDRDLVIPALRSELRTDALRELMDRIVLRRGFTHLQGEACLAEVLHRHDRAPSGLLRGMAFPNARLPEIDKPVMAVGVSKHGLDFESSDGKPSHVIFLYLGRAFPPPEERHMLTRLSAALTQMKNVERLMAASTANEIWESVMAMETPEPSVAR